MTSRKHRVVIVGAGFGGMAAAKALKSADAEVVVIDRRNHHLFQPLLYQVATAALSPSEIAWPIRHILRSQENAHVLMATVTGVDTGAREVVLEDGTREAYDSLILATGAQHAYFGHDEWEKYAPGLKTLEDATAIRRKLLLAFEAAERENDPEKRKALLTFAVIGAGPTGVELAGAIIELGRISLKNQFTHIKPEELRVVLIEAAGKVLGNFRPALSDYTLSALNKLGVEVELGSAVVHIDDEGVRYGVKYLPTRTVIWAAGVSASPAAKWLGIEGDRAGRVQVGDDLRVPGMDNVFVIGDVASTTFNGKPVPGVAPAAKQMGAYVAGVINRRLVGDRRHVPFNYKHAGDLATIGKRSAVTDFGKVVFTGWVAWWLWCIAHVYFLVEIKTRIFVTISWLWTHFTGQRSNRLIVHGAAETKKPLEEVTEK
ncbi:MULTISPECIES: NAD(P)/FAD-dependent oxidoreductase [unclassified Devosia]|uniref:NAD(P)/FAD-dependent oxidoreductase n=1 Tax=unclassified Devosia TaxID=196773 RepID=UPI00145DB0E9|nr:MULTISPECIES: NAD(P)/FAD-dependent oxidoreductase [unclassified Devosia]MBJ6987333.1 NAD(P)/FAD-dependent oxidoreductase [Devosia sp. MC521]QMW63509.1 NAD(P)/FAD-dependent oxidoreductase [Devosia sp. MC521]